MGRAHRSKEFIQQALQQGVADGTIRNGIDIEVLFILTTDMCEKEKPRP